MILKFKKEDNLKRKIVVTLIWLLALAMLANVFWDMYEMYVGEYEYPAFSFLTNSTFFFTTTAVLVPLGLVFKVKISRWLILFFIYVGTILPIVFLLMTTILSLVLHGNMNLIELNTLWIVLFGTASSVLMIYLFSNEEAQKLYGVGNFKKELKVLLSMVFVLSVMFAGYMYFLQKNINDVPIVLNEQ